MSVLVGVVGGIGAWAGFGTNDTASERPAEPLTNLILLKGTPTVGLRRGNRPHLKQTANRDRSHPPNPYRRCPIKASAKCDP